MSGKKKEESILIQNWTSKPVIVKSRGLIKTILPPKENINITNCLALNQNITICPAEYPEKSKQP